MNNILRNNYALCIGRQGSVIGEDGWDICFCSDVIIDFNLYRRGGNLVFPLYLYSDEGQGNLFETKKVNIDFSKLPKEYAEKKPEEIFYYIYAVLYSPTYRKKYAEFLKTDFPRVPFTTDMQLFGRLAKMGERLVSLHLLKAEDLPTEQHKYEGVGKTG